MTAVQSPASKSVQPDVDFRFQRRPGENPEPFIDREWLVTNGLGGYASGALLGISTRRYHGWFVPSLPGRGRTVLLPRLDEVVSAGGADILLGGAEEESGQFEGQSIAHLTEFRLRWQIPYWTFEVEGRRIQKRITLLNEQNTVCVEYRLLEGDPVDMKLRPFFTCRGHDDSLAIPEEWPFTLSITHGRIEVHTYESGPVIRIALSPASGPFVLEERENVNVFYRVEKLRGLDSTESLRSAGYFSFKLKPGAPVAFIATTESWDALKFNAPEMFDAEEVRLKKLLALAPERARIGAAAQLVLAADQFLVAPATRVHERVLLQASGDTARTIIAGYHWFTDWGRDTMISLEGLTLCTGRRNEARSILRTFGHYIQDGLLPNHFPEGQIHALYNTMDATLWYFHALDRYFRYTGDRETVALLYPSLRRVIERHIEGTRFNIGVDPTDGLLRGGAEGFALTWMDAKVENWVVTPRRGKPVEIQALWYNALRLFDEWTRLLGVGSEAFKEEAEKARASFNERFWMPDKKYLYDVVDAEDGGNDGRFRPNQLFAISLRHPVLDESRWRPVLDIVTDRLMTPVGLRTLAPDDKDYKPHYVGNRWERDAAYHQGLVWAWLVGHFSDAWAKVDPAGAHVPVLLAGFRSHLRDAGIGTISEIFDADAPHTPRGCIAQAWSVAEVLRTFLATDATL